MTDPMTHGGGGNRDNRRRFVVGLAALTLVGAALRFSGLGDRDFWFDESCTFIYVHNLFDWPEDSDLLVESTNLPYYALLRGWSAVLGDSEAGYRSMSALAAVLVIPVIGLAAGRMGGNLTGLLCAAIVTFHPLHVYYAHEARAYALWSLALSFDLWLLYEASRRTSWRWWIAYGLTLLGTLHLHYFTIWCIPATITCVLVARDRRCALRRWFVTTVLAGAAFVPYFLAAVWPASRGGGSAWIAQNFEPITTIPRTLWAFMPSGGYPAHLRGLSMLSPDTVMTQPAWLIVLTRALPAMVMIAVFLLLARRMGRREVNGLNDGMRWNIHAFAGGMTLLPLILAWLYSVLVRPNYLVGRYDLVAYPACMVWIAIVLAQLARAVAPRRSGLFAAAVCVPLLVCSLVPIARMHALKPAPTIHHRRAERLADLTSAGDLIVAFSYDRDHLLYYLYRAGCRADITSFPSWLDAQIGWVDTEADLARGQSEALEEDAVRQLEQMKSTLSRGDGVWLLADSINPNGTGPRGSINGRLFKAIAEAGLRLRAADEELLIARLQRASNP